MGRPPVLTKKQQEDIKQALARGARVVDLMKQYNVSDTTLRRFLPESRRRAVPPRADLRGRRFGQWLVLGLTERPAGIADRCQYWLCRCDCGAERPVNGRNLRQGTSTKCTSCRNLAAKVNLKNVVRRNVPNNYDETPFFKGESLQRVPEQLFGDAVKMVIRTVGPMDDEQAMRIVEAVFGPLKLLSPIDTVSDAYYASVCDHSYFRYEGGWRWCIKDHDVEGGDPHYHEAEDGTSWESDDASEFRAFGPTEEG